MIHGTEELIKDLENKKNIIVDERDNLELLKLENIETLNDIQKTMEEIIDSKGNNKKIIRGQIKDIIRNLMEIVGVGLGFMIPANIIKRIPYLFEGYNFHSFNTVVSFLTLVGCSTIVICGITETLEYKKKLERKEEYQELEESKENLKEYIDQLQKNINLNNTKINKFNNSINQKRNSIIKTRNIEENTISKQKVIEK